MSSVQSRLRYLTSCDAEAMSDYDRINCFVKAGHEAAIMLDEYERQLRQLRETLFVPYIYQQQYGPPMRWEE